MASTDARPIPRKNAAYRITFPIFDADGDLVTGAAGLDSEISKDGGTFADCTNEATEIATSSGMYYLDLTSTEMNADTVAIIVKTSTSGAKTTPIVLYPEEAGDIRVNVTQLNGTNQTAGNLMAAIDSVDLAITGLVPYDAYGPGAVGNDTTHIHLGLDGELGDDAVNNQLIVIQDATTGETYSRWIEDFVGATSLATVATLPFTPDAADTWWILSIRRDTVVDTLNSKLDTIDDFLDTEIAAIKAKTDNLPSDPADASDIASSFTTVNSKLDTIDDFLDTEIAAIKAKTDNLPADPADASDIASSFTTVNSKLDTIDDFLDTEIAAIKAKTDNLPSDPADASDIATSFTTVNSKLDAIDDYVDTEIAAIKTVVDGIQSDLDNGTDGLGALKTAITAVDDFVDTEVTAIKAVTDKLDDTLEDDGGTYRFTENALEQAPTGSGGGSSPTAAQIADAVWDERIDDHLGDRSFGSKIGIHLPFVAPDINYKKISKIVDESISKQVIPEAKEPDLTPISEGLQALLTEIRAIKLPDIPETDLSPIESKLEALQSEIKKIEIPETDFSETNELIKSQEKILSAMMKLQEGIKDGQIGRIREFFEKDVDQITEAITALQKQFAEVDYIIPTKQPKENQKEEPKKSHLEEYLNLDK